ncbi:unnamed protein product [Triticum aestivum]|uniref:Uncharacterized protein n=1 Tax=Triticum aestivum TaxID=4565 RepID=A0A7H4LMI1_WHEAT|nr:unnamed protein product [Triticum aestivum]
MAQNFEAYVLGCKSCTPPWECFVKESAVRHIDFDGTSREFYPGKYIMGPMISDCLMDRHAELESYSLMKNFRHPNVVTVENFYDHWGCPRFVLSWVDGSLSAWMKGDGAGRMFKSTMKGSVPTGALRRMIIDLCSGLERLIEEQLYPLKIELNDICVRRQGQRGIPLLYINRVEKLSAFDGRRRQGKLWGDIRRALKEVYKQAPAGIDPIAQRFINYVGVKDVSALQGFLDLWDYRRKARFLLSIISNDISG